MSRSLHTICLPQRDVFRLPLACYMKVSAAFHAIIYMRAEDMLKRHNGMLSVRSFRSVSSSLRFPPRSPAATLPEYCCLPVTPSLSLPFPIRTETPGDIHIPPLFAVNAAFLQYYHFRFENIILTAIRLPVVIRPLLLRRYFRQENTTVFPAVGSGLLIFIFSHLHCLMHGEYILRIRCLHTPLLSCHTKYAHYSGVTMFTPADAQNTYILFNRREER